MAKSRILKEVHETARGLHEIGVFSDVTMRNFDKLCLALGCLKTPSREPF